jgi:hypothetical protein
VQRGVTRCVLPPGEVPPYVQRRMISLRAYDQAALMLAAEIAQARMSALGWTLFADPAWPSCSCTTRLAASRARRIASAWRRRPDLHDVIVATPDT